MLPERSKEKLQIMSESGPKSSQTPKPVINHSQRPKSELVRILDDVWNPNNFVWISDIAKNQTSKFER